MAELQGGIVHIETRMTRHARGPCTVRIRESLGVKFGDFYIVVDSDVSYEVCLSPFPSVLIQPDELCRDENGLCILKASVCYVLGLSASRCSQSTLRRFEARSLRAARQRTGSCDG